MNRSGAVVSADLGSSSSYSNESLSSDTRYPIGIRGGEALKAVVEKVSLRVALMQRLVGPKRLEKSILQKIFMNGAKGDRVNIPELQIIRNVKTGDANTVLRQQCLLTA